MSDPKNDDLDLDLDLQLEEAPPAASAPAPVASMAPSAAAGAAAAQDPAQGASIVAEPAAAAPAAGVEGQWVWQFAAPAPPPPFSAVFFAGRAFAELYRFFAAGVLVALGALLPWGSSARWLTDIGAEVPAGYAGPTAGVATPAGALCLALSLWLVWAACYGIYSGRQKILPVFLMLVPAWMTWSRTLDAWGRMPAEEWGLQLKLVELFQGAGPGVMLAWAGSTLVVVQLALTIGKLFRKDPKAGDDKARARKPRDEKAAKAEA
ncbi:MAG: hypothetical protein FJ296_07585, partial [Planctomycetes bacterium]|nr:hypothetical protein [Planctomycetota bacterium]